MDRQTLITKAQFLVPVPFSAAREYSMYSRLLAAEVTRRLMEREDIEKHIGSCNSSAMEDNHRNHSLFMASLLGNYHPETLIDTVLWVMKVYRSRGFSRSYWELQLRTWLEVLPQYLSPESNEAIAPFYRFLLAQVDAFDELHHQEQPHE
ncbi:hypothetical protein [Desulfurispira natronophila]|uniref:Uncharacterized protein n=1 Tax=Desulfurispira natronophila TaxID=682562 RepID=A0A7W7Y2C3_9BACT|nr:hypothetical protein [Desulfurispira natronophila]MBB5020796.1 hypothetical protein [Desulfurispira natronophila]